MGCFSCFSRRQPCRNNRIWGSGWPRLPPALTTPCSSAAHPALSAEKSLREMKGSLFNWITLTSHQTKETKKQLIKAVQIHRANPSSCLSFSHSAQFIHIFPYALLITQSLLQGTRGGGREAGGECEKGDQTYPWVRFSALIWLLPRLQPIDS